VTAAVAHTPETVEARPAAQLAALWQRVVIGYLRRPGQMVFPIVFPLFFALLNSGQFHRATSIPGFPEVDGFIDFIAAATITQGVMFGAIQSGTDLATDIQGGFFDRLLASPMSRGAVLGASLLGAMTLAAAQTVFFIVVLTVLGATFKAGLAGMLVLVAYGALIALAQAGFMCGVAIKTGSTEVVQSVFPMIFVLLFLSAAFFPVGLMIGWYRWVAEKSPITWMVEGARDLVIGHWNTAAALKALGVPAAFAVVTVLFAARALRRRLAAT